jgi:6-pyruvoyltetrahydropterin/6-carboxytetrahydropterin synthase
MEEECYLCGMSEAQKNGLCKECESVLRTGAKMTIYKKCRIEIAHKLEGHTKCGTVHGHSIDIVIGLHGQMSVDSGMVIDFNTIKHHIQEEVIDRFDHTYLNDTLPIPTAEFLALFIYTKLKTGVLRNLLSLVRVHETENNYVEYTGEELTKHKINSYEDLHKEINHILHKYNIDPHIAMTMWEDGFDLWIKNKREESEDEVEEWGHVCTKCRYTYNPHEDRCPECGYIRTGITKNVRH